MNLDFYRNMDLRKCYMGEELWIGEFLINSKTFDPHDLQLGSNLCSLYIPVTYVKSSRLHISRSVFEIEYEEKEEIISAILPFLAVIAEYGLTQNNALLNNEQIDIKLHKRRWNECGLVVNKNRNNRYHFIFCYI